MSGCQVYRWCSTCFIRLAPTHSAQAPAIPRFKPGEAELGFRCDQIITDGSGIFEKNTGHLRTDYMGAHVCNAGITAAIPVKTGQEPITAGLQWFAEYIDAFGHASFVFEHLPQNYNSRGQVKVYKTRTSGYATSR